MKLILRISAVMLGITGAVYCQSSAPSVDTTRGVENGASFVQGQAVAPGSLVSIFGTNFAASFAGADSVPLSTSLANVTVTVNNIPAPMVAVNQTQANFQLPWEAMAPGAQSGTAQVVISNQNGSSTPINVQVIPTAPGLFDIGPDSTGVHRPAAFNNADGALPLPTSVQIPGFTSRPAKAGDNLALLATGLGPVSVTPPDGAPPTGLSNTQGTPVVMIGNVQAQVVFSGLSPQFPGINQVNIIIPQNAPTGDAVPVVIQMNGITTSGVTKIAISQ